MAQYRAIFQNAYFKGLATAAVVTMGLAAGQAQAKNITDTEFAAFTENQEITSDVIAIAKDAKNTNAITLTIKEGDTHAITGGTTTFSNGNIVLSGSGAAADTKLTIKGGANAGTSLDVKNFELQKGTLDLSKHDSAAQGGTLTADQITIGQAHAEQSFLANPNAPTAVVTVGANSTLGEATSVYQLYEGAQITVAEGGILTGASLKAAGGKIIYNDNANFALKSYNENDDEKPAQKLDLDVAAGKTLSVKLAGKATDNRGVLHFASGSTINLASATDTSGTLAISGATDSGSLVILDSGVNLTSTGADLTTGGVISVTGVAASALGTAELQTDADVLGKFLVGSTEAPKAAKGGVLLDANSKLTINNKKVILGVDSTSLNDNALSIAIKSGDDAVNGEINVKDSVTTTLSVANELVIGKQLHEGNLATQLNVEAGTLTLGSSEFDSSTTGFGLLKATAKNVNFISSGSATLKLQDAVSLKNVDDSGNALDGTITGNVNLGKASTNLTITGGNYTYSGDMTIGAVTANLEVKADATVSASTLDFNGKLLLDRTAAAKITVSGDTTTEGSGVTSLDLTDATIEFTGSTPSQAITVEALDNATVKVKSDQLDPLFFTDNTKGVLFDVNGGELVIEGSRDFTASQFSSSTANSGIKFRNGTVSISETARIKGSDTIDLGASAVGDSKLKAQVLDIVNATASNTTTFQSGSFLVSQTLNTNSEKGFVLGEKGVVQLGTLEEVTPETGDPYYVAEGSGQVNNNVEVSGASSALNVLAGTWSGKDVTVKQLDGLKVGEADEPKNKAGEFITTKLSLNKLTGAHGTATTNVATVNKNATLEVNSVDLSAGKVTVNGTLSLNGVDPTGEQGSLDYGLKFQDNAVTLKTGSTLNLGSKVNQALGLTASGTITDFTPVDTVFLTDGVFVGESLSTVNLSLESGTSLSTAALDKINKTLFGANGTSGSIYLGQGVGISDIPYDTTDSTADTPVVNWSAVETNNGLMAVLPTFKDDKLMAAKVVVDQTGPVLGHVGSIMSNNALAGNKVQISGNGSLNSADLVNGEKLFAYNKNGDVLGLDISDNVDFTLANGGKAGDIKLGKSTLVIDGGASNAKTTVSAINGQNGSLSVKGDLDVTGDLTIGKATSEAGKTLTVTKNASFKDTVNLAGNTNISGTLTAAGAFEASGNLKVTGKATFNEKAVLSGAQNNLGVVEFKAADNQIAQGQTFASNVQLSANTSSLVVGTEETTENKGASATLITDTLSLQGGKLYIDPSYEVESSFVVADALKNADLEHNIAGTLDGTAVVLKNSVLALGVNNDEDGALDSVKAELAPLFNANGALDSKNGLKVGAVAYAAKSITLGDTDKLVVDANKTLTQHKDATATTYQTNITNSSLYLGANSALAVDGAAFGEGKAAVTFNKQNAQIYADQGAVVLVTGKDALNAKGNKLFDGAGLNLAGVGTPSLTVQTINGWFSQTLNGTNLTSNLKLDPNKAVIDADLTVVSAPVKDTLLSAVYEKHNYEEYLADQSVDPDYVLGNVSAAVTYNGSQYKYNDTDISRIDAEQKYNIDVEKTEALAHKNPDNIVVYEYASNALLENILTGNKGNAIDAETNARLAVFGGAPQAAIEAGASTYEAISARMGVGVSGVSTAANGQGGAIWVTPVYKSADADGFNADNKSYGADVKLYGLALGADIEVAPNFKVGGMFNVGSGDADGQGLGSNVSNDFDYYGLGLYAGYSMDAFSLVADVTYTAVDNDIEGNTDLGKVNASIDSTNLSVGVTGQYKLSLAGMDVTPHAGLRYSMIDMDDYATAYSQNDSDSINIFSLPVGVTIAKEYVTDTWTVKPSFDLTLTGNFGDDEVDATAKWNGYSNLSTTVKSEIMDNFTYGAAVGVSATSGNFGLGLGVNYTGSSNTDEFGVNANARYMF